MLQFVNLMLNHTYIQNKIIKLRIKKTIILLIINEKIQNYYLKLLKNNFSIYEKLNMMLSIKKH